MGRWVDVDGKFQSGDPIKVEAGGSGAVEKRNGTQVPLLIEPLLGDVNDTRLPAKFAIRVKGEDVGNEFVRSGNVLQGQFVDESGHITSCTLTDYDTRRVAPIGQWADAERSFLSGAPISIDATGAGHAHLEDGSSIPLQIIPLRDEHGNSQSNRFTIRIEGDASSNDFLQVGNTLQGKFFDGEQVSKCVLSMYDASVALSPSPLWGQDDAESSKEYEPIHVGDRVLVNRKRKGLVKFKGETKFRPGVT